MTEDEFKLSVYTELESSARSARDAILKLRISIAPDRITYQGLQDLVPAAQALVGALLKIDLREIETPGEAVNQNGLKVTTHPPTQDPPFKGIE